MDYHSHFSGKKDMTNRSAAGAATPVAAGPEDAKAVALDSAQRARLEQVASAAAQLYPHNADLPRAAIAAGRDYLSGRSDLGDASAELEALRRAGKHVRARARQIAVLALADGRPERAVAQEMGIDRWLWAAACAKQLARRARQQRWWFS